MTVIKFPGQDKEFEHCSYTDYDGDLGIGTLDKGIEVRRLNDDSFALITPDGSHVYDRKALAEFAWLMSLFLDSEERFKPSGKCIGCDY